MWQKSRVLFAFLVPLLAACSPMSMYYKPGETVTKLNRDLTTCQVAALKDAPVANQIRQRPPVYYPGYRHCDGYGKCYQTPGYWADGGVYTVDVNKDLRTRVTDMCMGDRGYTLVEIPLCNEELKSRVVPANTTVLPDLTPSSCAIRNADGGFQIVN
ncbi:MAG: hypothetical protein AAFR45_08810 [Pseudomonadota bacterium]